MIADVEMIFSVLESHPQNIFLVEVGVHKCGARVHLNNLNRPCHLKKKARSQNREMFFQAHTVDGRNPAW